MFFFSSVVLAPCLSFLPVPLLQWLLGHFYVCTIESPANPVVKGLRQRNTLLYLLSLVVFFAI